VSAPAADAAGTAGGERLVIGELLPALDAPAPGSTGQVHQDPSGTAGPPPQQHGWPAPPTLGEAAPRAPDDEHGIDLP